jgi:diguanylate cyclase (GGDEF)-like protein
MLKKTEGFRKSLQIFLLFLAAAVVLFSAFALFAVKTNVDIVRAGINTLRAAVSGNFAETIARIGQSISTIYWIVIAEIIAFGGGVIASLFSINHLVKLYFEMERFAMIDPLTEIYNKRATYKMLDNEIKRAERFKHPLTIIMMDIDYFKVYNDKNGHLAGDRLLKRAARIMRSKIRDVDVLGRYGGEEFIIILPETPHEGAINVAEKIRKTIKETHFPGEEKQPFGDVTISIGLATFHGEYKSREHLIASADALLYKAKEEGRNRLIGAYYK